MTLDAMLESGRRRNQARATILAVIAEGGASVEQAERIGTYPLGVVLDVVDLVVDVLVDYDGLSALPGSGELTLAADEVAALRRLVLPGTPVGSDHDPRRDAALLAEAVATIPVVDPGAEYPHPEE